jgi:predicted amidohydrolase
MADTAKHLNDMIQKRLNNRVEALNTLESSPMDNLPDEVKKMREIEAGKIRAVMQEQKDLIEIVKILFPDA